MTMVYALLTINTKGSVGKSFSGGTPCKMGYIRCRYVHPGGYSSLPIDGDISGATEGTGIVEAATAKTTSKPCPRVNKPSGCQDRDTVPMDITTRIESVEPSANANHANLEIVAISCIVSQIKQVLAAHSQRSRVLNRGI
jgi:hypothetical protein